MRQILEVDVFNRKISSFILLHALKNSFDLKRVSIPIILLPQEPPT